MPVNTPHDNFKAAEYQLMRLCYAGQKSVKAAGTNFLPKTSGMLHLESQGEKPAQQMALKLYDAYVKRAHFVSLIGPTVEGLLGLSHKSAWEVELPSRLEYLREDLTIDGQSIPEFSQFVTRESLVTGRLGLFADINDATKLPCLKPYEAESIINWETENDQATRIVLKEVEQRANPEDEFSKTNYYTYRVLDLDDGVYRVRQFETNGGKESVNSDDFRVIELDRQTLQTGSIPFTIAGATSTSVEPDDYLPLMPMAEHLLTAYRTSADYRQALHMVAQPTPWATGIKIDNENPALDERPRMLGAGAFISSSAPDAKFGFLETSGNGIEALKADIEEQVTMALMYSHVLSERGRQVESGEALQMRVMSRTASLRSVVQNGGFALEMALKHCADWINANRDEVVVKPNLEFTNTMLDSQMLTAFVASVASGEIPAELMWGYLRKADVTRLSDKELNRMVEESREQRADELASQTAGLSFNNDDLNDAA